MLVQGPNNNVDAVAIALTHRSLSRSIGKRNPIVFQKEVPVVVFAEQGIIPARNDEELVLVDPAGLQVGGEPKHEGIWAGSQIEEPKQEMKARDIGHVIICLDISGSMNELCGVINPRTKELVLNPDTNRPYTKLEHIQVAIKELITNGIPGNTPTTLIAYHTTASIPNGSGNTQIGRAHV